MGIPKMAGIMRQVNAVVTGTNGYHQKNILLIMMK
jgi:hypothetical protein